MKEKIKGWLASLAYRLIILCTLGQISPILGTGVIVEQDGKILCVERSDGRGYGLPGGIVRSKETVEESILRETYEETGYRVQITGLVGIYSSHRRDPRFRSVSITYAGTVLSGSLHSSGEGRPCWQAPADIFGQMAFDNETMLKDYLSGYQRLF